MTGQQVTRLVDAVLSAGSYRADWDGTDASGRAVASGSYFFRLRVGGLCAESRQVTLLK